MGNVGNFNSVCKNNRKRKSCKNQLGTQSTRESNSESRIEKFMKFSKEGPTFVCVICNRRLYFRTAIQFDPKKYDIAMADLVHQVSASQKSYICRTCRSSLKKSQIPEQAVSNILKIFPVPDELKKLNKLELALIYRRILFKQIAIMPKGRFPKLKGSICNISIHVNEITNILPHGADSNGLVIVKLKRKLSFRGHVYFETVCPESINQALLYLKKYIPLYQDITINMNNIPDNLKDLTDSATDDFHEPFDLEENGNLQLNYQCSAQESVLIPNTLSVEEINIAPGEG